MKRWMIAAAVAIVMVGAWASAEEVRPISEVVAEATAESVVDVPAEAPVPEPVAEPVAAPVVAPVVESVAPPAVELEDGKIVIDIPVWWAAMTEGVHSLAGLAWKLAFTFLAGLLLKRIKDTTARADAKEALEVSVNETWESIGKSWKHAATDGKFTNEERDKLKATAISGAKQIATGPGLKILKAWGQEQLGALIASIVEKRKAVAKK